MNQGPTERLANRIRGRNVVPVHHGHTQAIRVPLREHREVEVGQSADDSPAAFDDKYSHIALQQFFSSWSRCVSLVHRSRLTNSVKVSPASVR